MERGNLDSPLTTASVASAGAVLAPTTAAVGAILQAAIGLGTGEKPHPISLLGVLVAIVSIGLLATSSGGTALEQGTNALAYAAGAGLTLAFANTCFAQTSIEAGAWPGGIARLVATLILVPVVLSNRRPPHAARSRRGFGLALMAGVADLAATLSIMFALQRGSLVILGVLGGLFPLVTIVLARVLLNERMVLLQKVAVPTP